MVSFSSSTNTTTTAAGDTGDKTAPPSDRYKVGTLTYTRAGLVWMFIWMVCGSLAFTLMEEVFPTSIPLQLQRLGISDAWIAVLMGTFVQIINMGLSPIISFRSDRTRTRWGRRIPYIVVTMPFLCLTLAALGFTDDIGQYLHHSSWAASLHLSPLTLIMIVVGMLIVLYSVFNTFVNTVYWYLFADVVPADFLGRFMGVLGIVSSAAGMIFSGFIYGQIRNHPRPIYVGASLLYLVGMGLMCWRVREGQYPPPTDLSHQDHWWRRFLGAVNTYLRECFCHPIYISYYAFSSLWALTNVCSFALIFFYLDDLHFSMDHMGKFNALLGLIGMGIAFPLGWVVDRIHPMRATLLALVLYIPANFSAYYMSSFTMFMIIMAVRLPISRLFSCSIGALSVRLMPKKQYGQFCSANDMVRSFVLIFGSILGGLFVNHVHRLYGNAGYAAIWLWVCSFDAAALGAMFIVYLYWRKMGGVNFSYNPEAKGA